MKFLRQQSAFTLMEVVFSIFILAAALTTLLGLQNASLQRTIRDQNKQRAMLYARRVLSAIESGSVQAEPTRTEGNLVKILGDFVPDFSKQQLKQDDLSAFYASVEISPWKLPLVQSDTSLYKVTLSVSWSKSVYDRYEVTYFVPQDEILPQ